MSKDTVDFRGGTVAIVGTNSDPKKLSERASALIRSAEVVLHDERVPDAALAHCRDDATIYFVGNLPGREPTEQSEIDCQLVHYARMGLRVVRLTGGGATVFGCDESVALEREGIEFYILDECTIPASPKTRRNRRSQGAASRVAR